MTRAHPTRRPAIHVLVLAIALGQLGAPGAAWAGSKSPTPATVVYDLLIERPLGVVEVVTGVAITTVAYPVAALAADEGNLVVDHCVRTPSRSTFTRALGRLDEDRRSDCSPVAFGIDMTQLSIGAALQPLAWIFGGSPFGRGQPRDDGIEI